ncbi:D-aminoacyl-tRNA deacylase [Candidatus Methylacidithermus pantelleriae]|uniref:D-aminoacyl-tRNA deacylase n=1 Tax=Candidatus Methylacidithermus pantelleriae TaxID=2744239 RepID=A0A8J2FP72_9BACT|nr:D-aminoacyl-tRNA deacylase [Candidatus Methylacidithermus pantelleriae]CAF0700700.1 D-aminoacyl-tRNA deacylase [Candidatus Methylacidithermus pantelleriae]
MIALVQRVSRGAVYIGGKKIASIGQGILALVGIEREDTTKAADRLAERILTYRIFPDAQHRMNRCLEEIGGELLLVPQFTLAADTHKGTRASFAKAAPPEQAQKLYQYLVDRLQQRYPKVHSGVFGATMSVELTNEGPVTFWLQAKG